MITVTLCKGMYNEKNYYFKYQQKRNTNSGCVEVYVNARGRTRCSLSRSCVTRQQSTPLTTSTGMTNGGASGLNTFSTSTTPSNTMQRRGGSMRWTRHNHWSQDSGTASTTTTSSGSTSSIHRHHTFNSTAMATGGLRRTNAEKSFHNKKRVIQMLFVVVLEFFVCWTPLYVINTIALFNPKAVYSGLGYTAISFFQLLAYSSSCCNPITYCFMNCGFRKSFLNLFRCFKRMHRRSTTTDNHTEKMTVAGGSEMDSTVLRWPPHNSINMNSFPSTPHSTLR